MCLTLLFQVMDRYFDSCSVCCQSAGSRIALISAEETFPRDVPDPIPHLSK